MARGDKNYSERTHKVVDKSSDAKKKEVWDMVGAKKKLQEMVEALINSDSKTAAAALHDYLQVKTRAILGEGEFGEEEFGDEEHDDEDGDDDEMVADRHEDGEEGECPECHCEPCECSDDTEAEDAEDGHEVEDFESEHGEDVVGEGADGSRTTHMKKLGPQAKDLEQKVKGHNNFK